MIARIIPILLAFMLAAPVSAQTPAPFEYGPRPPLSVFDPSGFLPPEAVKEISDPLNAIYKNEGIDVVVVILKDLENAPPEHVARRFAREWCTSAIQCVVLHVPGSKDSPWIIPQGKLVDVIEPALIRQTVEEAQHRAARETKEPDKVRAAATEAADMLRFWTNEHKNLSEFLQSRASEIRTEQAANSRLWKVSTLLVVLSLILIATVTPLSNATRNSRHMIRAVFERVSWLAADFRVQ